MNLPSLALECLRSTSFHKTVLRRISGEGDGTTKETTTGKTRWHHGKLRKREEKFSCLLGNAACWFWTHFPVWIIISTLKQSRPSSGFISYLENVVMQVFFYSCPQWLLDNLVHLNERLEYIFDWIPTQLSFMVVFSDVAKLVWRRELKINDRANMSASHFLSVWVHIQLLRFSAMWWTELEIA